MKPAVKYDPDADAACIRFSGGTILESAEVAPGIILDYDTEGRIVGMEVLDARKNLSTELLDEAA